MCRFGRARRIGVNTASSLACYRQRKLHESVDATPSGVGVSAATTLAFTSDESPFLLVFMSADADTRRIRNPRRPYCRCSRGERTCRCVDAPSERIRRERKRRRCRYRSPPSIAARPPTGAASSGGVRRSGAR